MQTLWAWIGQYGVPAALYTDRKNVYVTEREPTVEEQLKGIVPLTPFEKACQKLGIRIVTAHSPQSKGRVCWVYPDRLVKEQSSVYSGFRRWNRPTCFYRVVFARRSTRSSNGWPHLTWISTGRHPRDFA
jgi:hypothetical protein